MDAVAVVEHFDGNKSLVVNNRFTMGGTGAAVAELRQGHIPLLLHPRPTAALFLGLGTGISFAAARSYPELFAVGVELLPEVVQQMSHFNPYNDLRGAEDRLRVIVADARRFVAASTEQFDVIVADLFHPARDGAAFLYTREHFHAVRKRLRREGLFCQWLPIFQLDEHGVRSITRTFLEVFPNACAFLLRFNVDTPVVGLIASTDRQRFPADLFAKRVAGSLSIEDLRRVGLRDELHLLGCFLAGPDRLRSYAAGAPINQDSSPAVLFGAPAYATRRDAEPYETLLAMLALQDPPAGILEDPRDPFAQELNRFVSARTDYLLGLMADARGESERALDLLLASAGKSEEFTTSYAHVLSLASQKLKSDPEMARKILLRLDQSQPSRPIARELLERMNAPSGR
jgi:spermidine synthase